MAGFRQRQQSRHPIRRVLRSAGRNCQALEFLPAPNHDGGRTRLDGTGERYYSPGLLKHHNIVEPCEANRFCPATTLTRAAIAPWLIRAVLRTDSFSASQTPAFTDVPAAHPQFRYIQKLSELGITTGCGNGRYCPDRLITRGELAVFLIRAGARIGPGAVVPHPAKPFFRDVPEGSPFFAFIQKLRQWGATSGCSATDFCPGASVTREQGATLLVRTLLTPMP